MPPLWLFTDAARLPLAEAAIAALPCGLAGVVLRDGDPARQRRIAALCRRRRLMLSVAGLPAGPGQLVHLRGGRRTRTARIGTPATASAHSPAEWRQACRAGAAVIFVSPVFATRSHPGARSLGVSRWCAIARMDVRRAAALGGIDGNTIRRLPSWCRFAGSISALGMTGEAPTAGDVIPAVPDASTGRAGSAE